ncbi:major histocompatibility complex class I-related gene protein-like [Leptodactylus fuscus]|uniref:major histocompatibility complex class I-related protein 1-like n=1 Tax=Leptodactylus fuscus TaxID=238119 RepID=UPI003F4F39DC
MHVYGWGSHSHFFYTTVTYNLSFDFPSYYTTRTLDDIPLFWFDSDNRVVERRVPWFKAANRSLLELSLIEYRFYGTMQSILTRTINYLNYREGYHVLQNMDGCTLFPNGSVEVIMTFHYNGRPLMSLDWKTGKWEAGLPEYKDLIEYLHGNSTISEEDMNNVINDCIPHITELLTLGECTLDRKGPVVKITQKPTDSGGVRLYCQAYGHYPKDISIMWYKNGQPISEEAMERLTLPLPDLTYLTSLSFNVSSVEDDVYTCKVNHDGLPVNFTQDWGISLSSSPTRPSIGGVIAICLAVILIIVIIVFGSVSFAKSRSQ